MAATPSVSPPGWVGVTPSLADSSVLVAGRRSPRLTMLAGWLAAEGCDVRVAARLEAILGPTTPYRPDVVVLDAGGAAPATVAGLRTWTDLPVVAVDSGRGAALEAVLDAGADDYAAVPLSRAEVLARLRAVLRRRRSPRADGAVGPGVVVATPHFRLDLVTHRAVAAGEVVHLTPTEWRVVEVLVRRPGVLVAQADVTAMVWGGDRQGRTHALRVHLSSIRHKLEPDPGRPRYFRTETGAGLRYVPPD